MDNMKEPKESNSRVAYNPGWNDPPPLKYNAQQTTPNKPRLNKRIAFPLSKTEINVHPAAANVPPMSSILPLTPIATTIQKNTPEMEQIDSVQALHNVQEILLDILNSSTELGTKVESIKRKINIMEEMWASEKINTQVQIKMQELTQALKEENPAKADEIHKALMVDHVSSVGSWMPGVKQLIYHCIARTELLALDKE